MISLKLIGDGPVVNNLFLNSSDVPIIIIAVICLFIAYNKIKKSNRNKNWSVGVPNAEDKIYVISWDVLMQPKKSVNLAENEIPFTNFSLKYVYYILGLIFVLIFISYVYSIEITYLRT